jgi:hypothetical protein
VGDVLARGVILGHLQERGFFQTGAEHGSMAGLQFVGAAKA